jgi:hypothetical protein
MSKEPKKIRESRAKKRSGLPKGASLTRRQNFLTLPT